MVGPSSVPKTVAEARSLGMQIIPAYITCTPLCRMGPVITGVNGKQNVTAPEHMIGAVTCQRRGVEAIHQSLKICFRESLFKK